jgi:hypothetical protein
MSARLLSFVSNPDAPVEIGPLPIGDVKITLDQATSDYADWTRTLPSHELWALIFGVKQPVDPVRVLSYVSRTVATCRRREKSCSLALRLPLGAAGGAALCFWLDWISRIVRWKSTIPTFFWSHDGRDGAAVIALGPPPPCTLAELWNVAGSRDQICDVATAPWQLEQVSFSDPIAVAVSQLGPHQPVAHLLHAAHLIDDF